jgi:predicted ATPase
MDLSSLKLNMNSPISILIGENGCGKSEVLSRMAIGSINEFSSVIAIATSVYDKFPRRNFK